MLIYTSLHTSPTCKKKLLRCIRQNGRPEDAHPPPGFSPPPQAPTVELRKTCVVYQREKCTRRQSFDARNDLREIYPSCGRCAARGSGGVIVGESRRGTQNPPQNDTTNMQ